MGANALLAELEDEKKWTSKFLSCKNGKLSFGKCSDKEKLAMMGCMATNNPAESSIGGTTHKIDKSGRVGLVSAGAIGDCKSNKWFKT